jgi:hypothetical protein
MTKKIFGAFWITQLLFFSASYVLFATTKIHVPVFFLGTYAVSMYIAMLFVHLSLKNQLGVKPVTIILSETLFLVVVYSQFLHFQCLKCDDLTAFIFIAGTIFFALLVEAFISFVYLKYIERAINNEKSRIMWNSMPVALIVLLDFLLNYLP